jgi:alkylresorcinol/alkylpyrone synthase
MAPQSPHPAILSVGRALPPHHVDQETLIQALSVYWGARHFNVDRLADVHRAAKVGGRHLALPLAEYPALDSFRKTNDAFVRVGAEVGEAAVRGGLAAAGLSPRDVDHLWFVTVTGVSTPSIDAKLMNRLGMKPSVKRTPIFGLGCLAGAAGLARASDALRAFPGEVGVLVSVELCSLTLQRDDASVSNLVATGLFGDGAAAVVLAGGERPAGALAPRIVATRSVFYPDTEWVMGWDVVDTGFKVVLSSKVPEVIEARVGGDVDAFLAAHGLARADVRHWVAHTGGPKVIEAFRRALGLAPEALERSWRSLREVGNLSSASVLFVLGDFLDARDARPGDVGLLAAMGPGFSAELLLLRW